MKPALMRLPVAVLTVALGIGAHAATRSIYISPATMAPNPPPAAAGMNPLDLNANVDTIFSVSFLLPADYKPNTTATLRLVLDRPGINGCTVILAAPALVRLRPGQAIYSTGLPSLDGMTNGAPTLINLPVNKVVVRTFKISAPTRSPFQDQLAGDGILVQFLRNGTNPQESCNYPVRIWQAEVRYEFTP